MRNTVGGVDSEDPVWWKHVTLTTHCGKSEIQM